MQVMKILREQLFYLIFYTHRITTLSVMMVAKVLGVHLTLKPLNTLEKEVSLVLYFTHFVMTVDLIFCLTIL